MHIVGPGLITLLLLAAFTALYFSKSIDKKPALLVQLVDKMTAHINQLALWSVTYGVVVAFLTLLMRYSAIDMLIHIAANVMLVLMALPFTFDKLVEKYREKVNVAIMEEADKLVAWTKNREKMVSYVSGAFCVLLFVIIFR